MIITTKNFNRKIVLLFALVLLQISFAAAQSAIKLDVDATEAARNVIHVREIVPVKAGKFNLFYPKFIPGEHAPTGTLNDVVNLFVTANGKPVAWQRDDVEMFAFHLDVPAGVNQIEIRFDDVSQPATVASAQLSRIKWNRLILYPRNAPSDNLQVAASLKFPADWKYATALAVNKESGNAVDFKTVSLTTLVDSPAVVGKNFRRVELGETNGALHEIDIFADTPEALEYKPETLVGWQNLIKQANAAFGARHYNKYKFLLTLSDIGGSEGLEHHESSEDGVGLKALSDASGLIDLGDLFGHEYAHSWNGKFRRPVGLATTDFEQPMRGELLWVYEGLTQYLGYLLPTRAGLFTPATHREILASVAAEMDTQTGRRWRPVVDTARAVSFTYSSPRAWRNERRRVDYYFEGALIWLEADALIRQKTNNKRSLDDFLQRFHGGQNSAAALKTYDFNQVVRTLNQVAPNDWAAFLNQRVYQIQTRAPLGGIENAGWKLVYNDTPNEYLQVNETLNGATNLMYSIGVIVGKDGVIQDINPDLAAYKAGLAPGMKITNVNNQDFSIETLRAAIKNSNQTAIVIVADNGGFKTTYNLNYNGGERYPHLERDAAKTDLLTEIQKAR